MQKYNFTSPTYSMFVQNVFGTLYKSWKELDPKHMHPSNWITLIVEYGEATLQDLFYVMILAFLWTVLRKLTTVCIFQPIVALSKLPTKEALKAPESAWKLIFYGCTWSYSCYILFATKHNFFYNVPSTFLGWKSHSVVPTKIYLAYLIQISFYVHSVYATLFVDVWRKDSVIMLLHHFVTLLLVGFSYVFRYTNVGILVLFLHDITDIILEGTKLTVYYKTKGGLWYTVCDFLSTIGFILFGIAWFVFRLYWFPLKAIYSAAYISQMVTKNLVFYHFFNVLLLILLAMDIYWFMLIVNMAYKILTKQVTEVDDTREFDTGKELNNKKKRQ